MLYYAWNIQETLEDERVGWGRGEGEVTVLKP